MLHISMWCIVINMKYLERCNHGEMTHSRYIIIIINKNNEMLFYYIL